MDCSFLQSKFFGKLIFFRTTKLCKVVDARETAPGASSRDMYGNDEWASKYGRI